MPCAWCTGCFSGPSRRVWGGLIWCRCRCRCRLWRRWSYTHPARCSAPGVVFGPYRVACGARGVSGWVFASVLLFLSFCFSVFASLVSTRSVRLTLRMFCSVFRVLALCCCASSCAAAGDDSPQSCYKCFSACNLVDVTNTHTHTHTRCLSCAQLAIRAHGLCLAACILWLLFAPFRFTSLVLYAIRPSRCNQHVILCCSGGSD